MESRTAKTIRNAKWGFVNSIVNMLLPFVVRSFLIYKLGTEYSGLNSLFNSILTVLNLTELGFSTAIVYSMYKPVAENDKDKICALLNVYKKAYRIIGCIILAVGLGLLPFIPCLIKESVPGNVNIYVLYLVYIFDTVISYFLYAYKTSLLSAHQREDILSRNSFFRNVVFSFFKIIVLLFFPDYYLYVLLLPLSTIFMNILNKRDVDKVFPEYLPCGNISESEKKELKKNLVGLTICVRVGRFQPHSVGPKSPIPVGTKVPLYKLCSN